MTGICSNSTNSDSEPVRRCPATAVALSVDGVIVTESSGITEVLMAEIIHRGLTMDALFKVEPDAVGEVVKVTVF